MFFCWGLYEPPMFGLRIKLDKLLAFMGKVALRDFPDWERRHNPGVECVVSTCS